MRVGNWLVFFQAAEGADLLNAYVKADTAVTALAAVARWEPPVIIHGMLSPDVQDQLHLS